MKKKLFVWLLTASLLCMAFGTVLTYAAPQVAETVESESEEQQARYGGSCIQCGGLMKMMCWQDMNLVDQGYHVKLGSPCYARYYKCRTYNACWFCGNYEFLNGMHYCKEIHESCSKGEFDVCPAEVTRKEFLGF